MKTAATLAPRSHDLDIVKLIATPFKAVWRFLVRLAESDSRIQAVNRLNAMSDADLSAKGLTRDEEVRRIFAGSYYS